LTTTLKYSRLNLSKINFQNQSFFPKQNILIETNQFLIVSAHVGDMFQIIKQVCVVMTLMAQM